MRRYPVTFSTLAVLSLVALCGATSAQADADDSGALRLQIRGAWLADLVGDPPPPPELLEQEAGIERDGSKSDDRPVYRKAWFVMAAAGVAVLAAGMISLHGDSDSGGDAIPHLGFPPPPNKAPGGSSRPERWNR